MSGEVFDILIVDDQAGVRRLLYETLRNEGYRVETAAGGVEALRKISSRVPSLILLDIKMPGMNGLDTLEELRKVTPDTPVVMMTAYGELDILDEARERGVRHYIIKPFDLDEVRYLVKGLLAEEKKKRRLLKGTG
ncbi:MAG: response regulator [Peptococcaceae bacterium]|nr:response regulator [Peptococcaceae bacterium]